MSNGKKYLVVGAGLSGAVIARELAEHTSANISVIDIRNHIAGNAYDYKNEHGIIIHKYGPHIFHTSNLRVVNYLSRFTKWTAYHHKVKAKVGDRLFTLPPNSETRSQMSDEQIIETFYRPYSEKMWGMKLEELNPDIIGRVPVREDLNDLYFPKDVFQAFPKNGYTALVENILDHDRISIRLELGFSKEMELEYDHIFNCMPIDEYYDYRFGELPYRSIKFHTVDLPLSDYQKFPTINFTDTSRITRVTEWKKYPRGGANNNWTTVTFEEPCSYKDNNYERYYPVKDKAGKYRKVYEKYANISNSKVTFTGRTGLYLYLNMDQAVANSLSLVNKYLRR